MKKRILTGDRPTDSQFHLGNYIGTLQNRVKLQEEYETFVFIADLHALTTHSGKTERLRGNIINLLLMYLAVGLLPEKVTFFVQSRIPAIPQLTLLLSMLTPVPVLERQPALKEKLQQGNTLTHGLLGYPVLMAADILCPRADLVPVGKDQKAHVEFARDIAQKFNSLYGETLTLPEPLIGEGGTLVGTDGKAKMSKSLGNAIFLLDDEDTVKEKVAGMYTDPNRIRATDPGRVEGNPVFAYHDAFNFNKEEIADLKARYVKGSVGDIEVKQKLATAINTFLAPIRSRYQEVSKKKGLAEEVLEAGNKKVAKIAAQTLGEAKEAMKLF